MPYHIFTPTTAEIVTNNERSKLESKLNLSVSNSRCDKLIIPKEKEDDFKRISTVMPKGSVAKFYDKDEVERVMEQGHKLKFSEAMTNEGAFVLQKENFVSNTNFITQNIINNLLKSIEEEYSLSDSEIEAIRSGDIEKIQEYIESFSQKNSFYVKAMREIKEITELAMEVDGKKGDTAPIEIQKRLNKMEQKLQKPRRVRALLDEEYEVLFDDKKKPYSYDEVYRAVENFITIKQGVIGGGEAVIVKGLTEDEIKDMKKYDKNDRINKTKEILFERNKQLIEDTARYLYNKHKLDMVADNINKTLKTAEIFLRDQFITDNLKKITREIFKLEEIENETGKVNSMDITLLKQMAGEPLEEGVKPFLTEDEIRKNANKITKLIEKALDKQVIEPFQKRFKKITKEFDVEFSKDQMDSFSKIIQTGFGKKFIAIYRNGLREAHGQGTLKYSAKEAETSYQSFVVSNMLQDTLDRELETLEEITDTQTAQEFVSGIKDKRGIVDENPISSYQEEKIKKWMNFYNITSNRTTKQNIELDEIDSVVENVFNTEDDTLKKSAKNVLKKEKSEKIDHRLKQDIGSDRATIHARTLALSSLARTLAKDGKQGMLFFTYQNQVARRLAGCLQASVIHNRNTDTTLGNINSCLDKYVQSTRERAKELKGIADSINQHGFLSFSAFSVIADIASLYGDLEAKRTEDEKDILTENAVAKTESIVVADSEEQTRARFSTMMQKENNYNDNIKGGVDYINIHRSNENTIAREVKLDYIVNNIMELDIQNLNTLNNDAQKLFEYYNIKPKKERTIYRTDAMDMADYIEEDIDESEDLSFLNDAQKAFTEELQLGKKYLIEKEFEEYKEKVKSRNPAIYSESPEFQERLYNMAKNKIEEKEKEIKTAFVEHGSSLEETLKKQSLKAKKLNYSVKDVLALLKEIEAKQEKFVIAQETIQEKLFQNGNKNILNLDSFSQRGFISVEKSRSGSHTTITGKIDYDTIKNLDPSKSEDLLIKKLYEASLEEYKTEGEAIAQTNKFLEAMGDKKLSEVFKIDQNDKLSTSLGVRKEFKESLIDQNFIRNKEAQRRVLEKAGIDEFLTSKMLSASDDDTFFNTEIDKDLFKEIDKSWNELEEEKAKANFMFLKASLDELGVVDDDTLLKLNFSKKEFEELKKMVALGIGRKDANVSKINSFTRAFKKLYEVSQMQTALDELERYNSIEITKKRGTDSQTGVLGITSGYFAHLDRIRKKENLVIDTDEEMVKYFKSNNIKVKDLQKEAEKIRSAVDANIINYLFNNEFDKFQSFDEFINEKYEIRKNNPHISNAELTEIDISRREYFEVSGKREYTELEKRRYSNVTVEREYTEQQLGNMP